MSALMVLDVTLRDGGHCCDFQFDRTLLTPLLSLLDESGIDCIEVGYRNGFLNQNKALGESGLCQQSFLLFCRSLIKSAKLSVMAHPSLICDADIKELALCGVDLLRLCVGRSQPRQKLINTIALCQRYQLDVSVNVTHASQYEEDELFELMDFAIEHGANKLYLADSNGSFLPMALTQLYRRLIKRYSTFPIGFHGHDNLGLAQTNTLLAMDAGVSMIDASLLGAGKGAGNLSLESFTAFLYARGERVYDFEKILTARDLFLSQRPMMTSVAPLSEFIRGIDDLSTAQVNERTKTNRVPNTSMNKLLEINA